MKSEKGAIAMLTSEFKITYETKIGDTLCTITSECPEDTREDILDVLVRLIKRDIAGVETERKAKANSK
jgi:hypothetical protein